MSVYPVWEAVGGEVGSASAVVMRIPEGVFRPPANRTADLLE